MKIQEASKKLLRENLKVKPKETLVIVTDRKNCPIFKGFSDVAKDFKINLIKVRITRNRAHSSLIPELASIFKKADAILAITDKSISHCPETRIARKKYGVRVISMVEVDRKLFLKSIKTNMKKVKKINKKFLKLLTGKKIKITTKSGTDIAVDIGKEKFKEDDGDSTKKGKLNNFPFGEVMAAPISIANGILAVDFSRAGIKPKDKAQVILKDGRIVQWNKNGKRLCDYLLKAGGKEALRIVELGFGTNPEHKNPINIIIHDEKILGSAHIAFGGFGNKRICRIHEDIILLKPTVFVNGKKIMENGKLLTC